jgi:hypothetical protein
MKNILNRALPQCLAAAALAGVITASMMAPQQSYAQTIDSAAPAAVSMASSGDVKIIDMKAAKFGSAKTSAVATDMSENYLISNTLIRNSDMSIADLKTVKSGNSDSIVLSGNKQAVINGLSIALRKMGVEFAVSNSFAEKLSEDKADISTTVSPTDTPSTIINKIAKTVVGMDAGMLKDNVNPTFFGSERKVGDLSGSLSETKKGLVVLGEADVIKKLSEDNNLKSVAALGGVTAQDASNAVERLAAESKQMKTFKKAVTDNKAESGQDFMATVRKSYAMGK